VPTVCMINRKGGVGKTTLTLALADFLSAIHGYRILVIDVDPQANASVMLLGEDDWKLLEDAKLTVADLFERAVRLLEPSRALDLGQLIRMARHVKGASGQLHVLASSPRLQYIEENATETLASWSPYVGSAYMILHQTLFAHVMKAYDYVLIDCPPSIGMITLNALTISSGYLIPTIPDYVSTVGLTQVTQRVKEHAHGLRRKIPLYGTVVNKFKRSRLHSSILEELRGRPEAQPLWDTIVPDTVNAGGALNQTAGLMTLKQRYGGGTDALYTSLEALTAEFLQRVF
jgi:chromosome partitioning protein